MISELFLRDMSLWGCVWQSTLFAVTGLAGSFFLRRRPARACQVLFLAMIAAVLVPTISILVKHFELGVFTTEPIALESEVPSEAIATYYEASVNVPQTEIRDVADTGDGQLASVKVSSGAANISSRTIVLYGWIIATFILIVRLFVAVVNGICLLRRAQSQVNGHIQQAADFAIARFGITKGLLIRSSKDVHSPLIWCWSRPAVLLVPSNLDHRVDWVGVICHELAHWRRWDHISGLIAELVICILPWNPLLWWSKKRMVRLSEQACDDWVVSGGQHCEDYAQSLLDFKPQKQVAFVPAVIHSGWGLGDRIRRILKDNCGNPRTGTIWALAVSIVAACLAAGVAFAQTRPGRAAYRIVHFPKDRPVGQLHVQDAGAARKLTYWFHWTGIKGPEWESLCEAQGDVRVPAGKRLSLDINQTAWRDLSWLSKLRPDDLYKLGFPYLPPGDAKPGDRCMPHIARMTGLKFLPLDKTNVTDGGFKYIRNLKSLEYLGLSPRVTDRGMAYLAESRRLKGLYFPPVSSQVTDAGLRHLAQVTSLEELYLKGQRMGDYGLVHLRGLPRLEYLALYGSNFTDKGMVYVKDIPSLRILSFHESLCRITDAGLVHISEMPKLEILCLHGMRNITDDGLAHLTKMRSLKKLEIGVSQVTDRGLAYLSQIKTLERIDLPQDQKGITDKGLTYLGTMPNLKHLAISRIHFIDPNMNKEYYTDKGLAELANCRLFEELYIGSPGITDEGLRHVAKLTNLKKLMLFGCDNVTNEGLAQLTTLKSLKHLSITDSKITIGGLTHLNKIPGLYKLDLYEIVQDHVGLDISGLTNLEELNLTLKTERVDREKGLFITQLVTFDDLTCLGKLKLLRWLQGINGVTDAGLKQLAGLTNMERLSFGATGLTDEGLKSLANMKKLDLLSINNKSPAKVSPAGRGKLTDEGLSYLEGLKMLTYLQIDSDNTFSTAALQRLRKELPNLYCLNINGEDKLRQPRSAAPLR